MSPNPTADGPRAAVEPARHQLARLAAQTDLPLPEVFRRVCEAAAEALQVERTGVWLFVNGDRALRCVSLFERSKRKHSKGASLALAEPSEYFRAVSSAPLLACEAARSDPRTAELGDTYLAPNGITSLLDAPLVRDDRLVGVVAHEHVGPPREWTDADRTIAQAVADLVVEKMRVAEGALRNPPRPGPIPVRPVPPRPEADGEPAHEFRNLLAEIVSHAELIALAPDLPPGVADRVAKIAGAATRGVALLRGLLDPRATVEADTGEHESLPPG